MSISNVGGNTYASHTGYIPTATVNGRTYGVRKASNHDESSNNSKVTQNAQSVEASKKLGYPYASHKGSIPTVTVNGKTYGPSKTLNHDESTNKQKEQAIQSESPKVSKKSSSPYANHKGYIPYATVNGRTYGLGKPTSTLSTNV